MIRCSRNLAAVLIALSLCGEPRTIWSSDGDGSWNNLKQVSRRTAYIVVAYNRDCFGGDIKSIDDSAVTITRRNAPEVTIQRRDVLRVTQGEWSPGVIFTGRSSWSDVVSIVGKHFHPNVAVHMNSGQKHKGKLVTANEAGIALESSGKTVNIGKREVSAVSYIRAKPLSDSAAYANDELFFMKVFDPELWPHLLHLQSPLSVRLYDASLPEDDSPIICRNDPWLLQGRTAPDVGRPPFPPQTR